MPPCQQPQYRKHRTYLCPRCLAACLRPLHDTPRRCACGRRLAGLRFRLDDADVAARNGYFTGRRFG